MADDPKVFALSSICCTVVATVINTAPNRKLLGYSYRQQIGDILPNLLISFAMAAVVMLLDLLPWSVGLLLPLQILAGVAVYVGLSAATRNESFHYLLRFILQLLKRG